MGGGLVVGSVDVGLVTFEEWAYGSFGAYIFWINGGFKLERINIQ